MKIIHITDPHVRPEGDTIYGIDSGSRLATVLGDVMLRHRDADLIAVTGDLTHHGEPSAYRRLAGLLDGLPIPVRLMLGNHDHRGNFRAAFPKHPIDDAGFIQSAYDAPGRIGRLIFLDTHEPGRIGGHLCRRRLDWLAGRLQEAGDRPVTIFQHHPPLPVGAPHFENICMAEPEAYLDLLTAHPGGIRHIFLGHIHIPVSGMYPGGLPFTAGRGCSHQMVLDMQNGDTPWMAGVPNYNVVTLEDDHMFVHACDMIHAEAIGTAEAPTGP